MGLNYRQPLYVDFEYNMEVVKYDIHTNPEVTNKQIFDTVNWFFLNNIEKFEAEYLNSNLQRIIDQGLGFDTGINFETHLYGVLCEDMIDTYYATTAVDYGSGSNEKQQRIIVNLAWPFENIFSKSGIGIDGPVETDLLPRIDTENFVFGTSGNKPDNKLHVDYAKMALITNQTVREIPIWLGNKEIGVYRLDVKKNIIELDFDFGIPKSTAGETLKKQFFGDKKKYPIDHPIFGVRQDPKFPNDKTKTIGPDEADFRDYARFNIVYAKGTSDSHTVNAPFNKNVIPRLKKIQFKY